MCSSPRVKQRLMRAAVRAAMASEGFVRLVGRKRQSGRDAGLDPQIAAALEYQRIVRLPALDSMDPARARRFVAENLALLDLDSIAMAEVIDARVANGIPVRVFVPEHAGPDWIVYLHGGGGVMGSIASSEPVTRYLAASTRCTVASVEYRLGPENRHPAAIDDACAAYRALITRVSRGGRIAVAGESFGAYLAVEVEHRTRGERRPDLQILICPVVDLTLTQPSVERNGERYLLTMTMMRWFRSHYLHDADPRAASPYFWPDVELRDAAPALLVTAGFDPLVDEGDAWAERLRAAGTTVRHRREDALVHGFLSMAGAVRAARAAVDRICSDIVDVFHE
jgi:acetyl esterase